MWDVAHCCSGKAMSKPMGVNWSAAEGHPTNTNEITNCGILHFARSSYTLEI